MLWQAAAHLLGSFTFRGGFQTVNQHTHKNILQGSPWGCPHLAQVEATKRLPRDVEVYVGPRNNIRSLVQDPSHLLLV